MSFDNLSSEAKPLNRYLTIAQAAELFQVSATTIRRLQQKRHIPFLKVGGVVRFSIDDLEAYAEKQRVKPLDQ